MEFIFSFMACTFMSLKEYFPNLLCKDVSLICLTHLGLWSCWSWVLSTMSRSPAVCSSGLPSWPHRTCPPRPELPNPASAYSASRQSYFKQFSSLLGPFSLCFSDPVLALPLWPCFFIVFASSSSFLLTCVSWCYSGRGTRPSSSPTPCRWSHRDLRLGIDDPQS